MNQQPATQVVNAMHVASAAQDPSAAVEQVELVPFSASVKRHMTQALGGDPLGQVAAHSLLQGEPAAQPQLAIW